ncbi:unnamed protein product [Rhizoctonia solani]|uniref:Rho-GAP domain-containing protein n=1 Tax=Rhizoctonia solani TaxID=456999 RepID=A0A8H3HCV3_9AGAM|nr:unnamed protein product [Rhizoctonia solani]
MSTDEPKVAPSVSLPLTFQNSFWTPDYRTGLNVLFDKLEQGIAENAEVVTFVRSRVAAERNLAASLINPPLTGTRGTGFDADDGAALLRAFQGLQAESAAQGNAHKNLAHELDTMVADPFEHWAAGHAARVRDSHHVLLDVYIKNYEEKGAEVNKLKQAHLNKTRLANEAEDDAKFAPHQNLGDAYTSPRLKPTTPSRASTVSDRILQHMGVNPSREDSIASDAGSTATAETSGTEPRIDKGKGRATSPPPEVASPPPMSPAMPPKLDIPAAEQPLPPILLAGLALTPAALSALLLQASKELKTTTVKLPFIAEYRDCFTGADFVDFLKAKLPGLGDSVERVQEAARDLTERENLLRRIGELGNAFEDSQAALYQLRPKATEMRASLQPPNSADKPTPSPSLLTPASNMMKRSGTVMDFIQRAVKNVNAPAEPPHIRARNEADTAERAYRAGIRALDKQRLGVEEKVEEALKVMNRWEIERLRAVKTVLQQYQAALATLPNALTTSISRSKPLIDAFTPEADATALIERARTGPFRPFRPTAHLFENRQLGEYITDGHFGLDLGKWGAAAWGEGEAAPDAIPNVITALLGALEAKYPTLPSDEERRRTWIYEVPLAASHRLREAINDIPSNQDIPSELFGQFDAPVLAATTKLWFLELNPPLALWETWDELRKIYPSVGAAQTEDRRVEDLQTVLIKLPKVNLLVLDAIIKHLKELAEETLGADEPRDVYVAKLGLSIGRIFIRPKVENELSIQDRHPKLLVVDLIERYDEILPPTVTKKKKEVERKAPMRKRTKPFDQRISRRSAHLQDPRKLLEVQHANQLGRSRSSSNAGQRPTVQSPGATVQSPSSETAPPAPPAPSGFVEPGPPPPRPKFVDPGEPPRPTFAEPKNERPAFAEPKDDESSLAVPGDDGIVIQPPTPITGSGENPASPGDEPTAETPGSPRASSPSAPPSDAPLSRTPSGTTRGPLRGPRMAAKGPRAPPSSSTPPPVAPTHVQRESRGSVSSMISNFERPHPAANPSDYAPRGRAGRTNASAFGRREGQLATRSMASGSEDETVGK